MEKCNKKCIAAKINPKMKGIEANRGAGSHKGQLASMKGGYVFFLDIAPIILHTVNMLKFTDKRGNTIYAYQHPARLNIYIDFGSHSGCTVFLAGGGMVCRLFAGADMGR